MVIKIKLLLEAESKMLVQITLIHEKSDLQADCRMNQ
jgi:hypothetical protein